jgi:hypothetical protein
VVALEKRRTLLWPSDVSRIRIVRRGCELSERLRPLCFHATGPQPGQFTAERGEGKGTRPDRDADAAEARERHAARQPAHSLRTMPGAPPLAGRQPAGPWHDFDRKCTRHWTVKYYGSWIGFGAERRELPHRTWEGLRSLARSASAIPNGNRRIPVPPSAPGGNLLPMTPASCPRIVRRRFGTCVGLLSSTA